MPLAKGYKDPFKDDDTALPADPVGPIGQTDMMPPARPAMEMPKPQPMRMSDIPMTPDNQVDYAGLAKQMYGRNAQQFDENQVTREDLENNARQSQMRALMTGFANAAAKAGGTESGVGATAKAFDESDNALLNARKGLASEGYKQGMDSLKEMQSAPIEMIKAKQLQDSTDPNSELSRFSRDFYKRIMGGVALPDNMSANDIAKFAPDAVRVAQDQAQRDFQREMTKQSQAFQRNQQQQSFNQQKQLADLNNEARQEMAEMRAAAAGKDNVYARLAEPEKIMVKELSTSASKKLVVANQIDGFLKQFDKAKTAEEKSRVGQQMIKLLNSTEGADAVGAEEARRLANELEIFTFKSPSGLPRLGQDLQGFRERAMAVRESVQDAVKANRDQVRSIYEEFAPGSSGGTATIISQPSQSQGQPQTKRPVWTPPSQTAGR